MTIEQRQHDAEAWANAYADWLAADEQAHHYDQLRINAQTRLEACRRQLVVNACIGTNIRTRVFMVPSSGDSTKYSGIGDLVKVTHDVNYTDETQIELLKIEPNE